MTHHVETPSAAHVEAPSAAHVETPSAAHVEMEVIKEDPVGIAETGNGGTTVTTLASTTTVIIIGNGQTAVGMGMTMDQVHTQLIRPKG